MIGSTISHYRVVERLGRGAMGLVYKAQDLRLDRPVAIKLISKEIALNPELTHAAIPPNGRAGRHHTRALHTTRALPSKRATVVTL